MAYRSSSTNAGSSATPAATVPAGAASGDIAIIVVDIDAQAAAFDPADLPTGFTELGEQDQTNDGGTAWIGWKRLSAADTGSYTFGNVGASADWIAQCTLHSGRHATDPPVLSAVANSNAGNTTPVSIAANGLTAVAGDDLLWAGVPDVNGSGFGNGMTPPSGYTERQDAENVWANCSVATQDNVSAGATGTVTGSFALSAGNSGWTAWLVRIPVAAAGGVSVAVPAGSLTLSGQVPTVATTANQTISVPAGALTLSGNAPTVLTPIAIAVPAGSLTLTANAPTVALSNNLLIAVPAGSLTLTGNVPTVVATANQSIAVPAGSLTLTGQVPVVQTSGSQTIAVPAGTLALTANAPSVIATANVTVSVPAGTLVLAASAPTVLTARIVSPPAGALTLTALTPTVSVTANILVSMPLGQLALSAYAPTVQGDPLGTILETVPYLIEDTLANATMRVESIHCTVNAIGSTGSVTAQNPLHMALVPRGSVIDVTLGGVPYESDEVGGSRSQAPYSTPDMMSPFRQRRH